jgi:hypothetical protein
LYAKHRKAKFAGKSSWAVIAGVGDQRCWVVVILTDLKICGGLSWIANTDWSNLKFVVVWQMTNDDSEITKISCKSANILYFYKILQLSKPFYSQKPSKNVYKNGAKSPTLMKISLFLILMYCLLYNCFKNCCFNVIENTNSLVNSGLILMWHFTPTIYSIAVPPLSWIFLYFMVFVKCMRWNFLWSWENDGNSMGILMSRKYCKVY